MKLLPVRGVLIAPTVQTGRNTVEIDLGWRKVSALSIGGYLDGEGVHVLIVTEARQMWGLARNTKAYVCDWPEARHLGGWKFADAVAFAQHRFETVILTSSIDPLRTLHSPLTGM
jgi:hypothetical protein